MPQWRSYASPERNSKVDEMANKLSDVRRSLTRAKESAETRLLELDNERREIKSAVRSLDAALKALSRKTGETAAGPRSTVQHKPSNDTDDGAS